MNKKLKENIDYEKNKIDLIKYCVEKTKSIQEAKDYYYWINSEIEKIQKPNL